MSTKIKAVANEMQNWLNLVTLTKNPTDRFSDIDVFKVKNWIERLAAAPSPSAVDGGEPMRVFCSDKARSLGWDEKDGEGCIEFLMRRCYETGHEDALAGLGTPTNPEGN